MIFIAAITGLPAFYKTLYDFGVYICWVIVSLALHETFIKKYADELDYKKYLWSGRALIFSSFFGLFKVIVGGFDSFNPAEYICLIMIVGSSVNYKIHFRKIINGIIWLCIPRKQKQN